jgi:hypothetical protein
MSSPAVGRRKQASRKRDAEVRKGKDYKQMKSFTRERPAFAFTPHSQKFLDPSPLLTSAYLCVPLRDASKRYSAKAAFPTRRASKKRETQVAIRITDNAPESITAAMPISGECSPSRFGMPAVLPVVQLAL